MLDLRTKQAKALDQIATLMSADPRQRAEAQGASLSAVLRAKPGGEARAVFVTNRGPGSAYLVDVELLERVGLYRQTIDLIEPVRLLEDESTEVAWTASAFGETGLLRLRLTWTDGSAEEQPRTRDVTLTR